MVKHVDDESWRINERKNEKKKSPQAKWLDIKLREQLKIKEEKPEALFVTRKNLFFNFLMLKKTDSIHKDPQTNEHKYSVAKKSDKTNRVMVEMNDNFFM